MTVTTLTKENTPLWNRFLQKHPNTNMYQLLGWKTVFESVFGYTPHYLLTLDARGEPQGILPMFLMSDIFRRRYLVSNPFSNFAGICANESKSEALLFAEAVRIAQTCQVQYVEFRQLREPLHGELPVKKSFVTLMLSLSNDPEEHWRALTSRNRNKIRKAEKNGLTVDFGMQYLPDFHRVYAINLRHLGTPIFPYRMFETVAHVFKDQVDLLVLKRNDQVVSAMFLFKFKQTISEPWVASLREFNKIYVNNYLYWQAIKYACENGFQTFDFGRSTVDTGTYKFKRQWGAEPVQLHYQYFLNVAGKVPVVDANNNKYQQIIELWKRLPLALTKFAGPRLVQYLPEL
ncbi:MAG: FemAB family XrtA/PEP-CTERM system-associated protein [bacterium]